jgi:hypothetical protein
VIPPKLVERVSELWPILRTLAIFSAMTAWVTSVVKVAVGGYELPGWCWWIVGGLFLLLGLLAVMFATGIRRHLGARTRPALVLLRLSLLLGLPAIAVTIVLLVPSGDQTDWTLALILIGTLGLGAVTVEFSRTTLRLAAAGVVMGSLLLVLIVGNAELADEHTADFRATATELSGRLRAIPSGSVAADVRRNARRAINALCIDAGGVRPKPPSRIVRTCRLAEGGTPKDQGVLRLEGAEATKQVADLEVTVATGAALPAAKTRARHAEADLDAIRAARADEEPTASIADVVRAGGEALVRRVPGVASGPNDVVLETAGWVLLAVLALLWYRALEIRGSRHGIGPVSIEPGDSLKDDEDRPTVGAFTVAVLQNVPEPGSTPGSQTQTTVTDIIAAAPDPTEVLKKAFEAVLSVIRPSARYRVVVDYLELSGSAPMRHVGVARIFDARTGYSLDTVREADDSKVKALRATAYATAGWILSKSDRVPSWGAWSRDSSRALSVYMESTLRPPPPSSEAAKRQASVDRARALANGAPQVDEEPLVHELRAAQVQAPRSGVLTVLAAHELDNAGLHAEALELYVRAALVHRRYLAARYRAAVGLSILTSKPDQYWWSISTGTRESVVYGLRRLDHELDLGMAPDLDALASRQQPAADPHDGRDPGEAVDHWARAAAAVAVSHLENLDDSYSLLAVLVNALRRDERVFWWKLLRSFGRRQDRLMIRVACHGLEARRKGSKGHGPDMDAEHKACRGCGRAMYNLACWYMNQNTPSPAHDRVALELLEDARDQPDGRDLHRKWLEQDPDLEPLGSSPRFQALMGSLNE